MSSLPDGWVETSLGEVSSSKQYGYTESASTEKIGPKFLRITDIQHDFIDWNAVPYCPISEKDKLKYKLGVGDVVIARTGNSTGATATIKDTSIDAVFASYLIRFKIDPQIADYNFIDFSLRSKRWSGFVKSVKGGSAQGGANANNFAEYPINLPPLSEQKNIADMLSSFDEKIELLREQNKTLEILAQTIFKEWFVNFNYPNATGEMVDSELGEIPKGWRVVKVTELFEVRDGTHDSPKQQKSGKLLITSKHLQNHKLDFESAYLISEEDYGNINKRSLVETNDILFSMIGTIGLTYFEQSSSINYAIKNVGLFKTSQNESWVYYTYLWLTSFLGKDYIRCNKSGSTQEYISLTGLRNITFCEPPEVILDGFNCVLREVFNKIKNNASQVHTLSKTRDTLLPQLMSGRVRSYE